MSIERTLLRVTETKQPGTSFFVSHYEANNRQGEEYSVEVLEMLGLSYGEESDWRDFEASDEALQLHRDCSSISNNCHHGAAWYYLSADGQTLTQYFKGSVSDPVVTETAGDLYTERLAHNVEHDVEVEIKLFPADEHWNPDLDNEIV